MTTEADAKPLKKASVSSPPPTPTRTADRNDVFDYVGFDDVRKFEERKDLLTDPKEYPRDGMYTGLLLIFNQEKFLYEKERTGTRRDVNEIMQCFQRHGYNIQREHVLHDASTDEIRKKLKEVSEMDLSEYNCLIIFFLTHGHEGDSLLTADGSITTYEVWKNFSHCKHLENKPKMFVFQACKGGNFSTIKPTFITVPSTIVPSNAFSPTTYMGRDMLVVYSTVEGNVSFRSQLTGSWFIQELCKNFSTHGKMEDVFSLITRTTKCVSLSYFHNESGVNKKQMPVCLSTLSKKFYLNRNKDRSTMLMYMKYSEEIMKQIEETNATIDDWVNKNLKTQKLWK